MSQSRTPEDDSFRIREHPVLGPLPPARIVTIDHDGQPVAAREDEPLIAALFAAGIRVLRTMPESGEPRGGYCLVGRCTDCLMVVDGVLNVRACVTPVRDGMRVATQRGLGSWDSSGTATGGSV
jgi:hypothetical protein